MAFCTGGSVGFLVFSVSEPLWHQHSNFFAKQGYHSQDEVDSFALTLTITHWGLTGWSEYLCIAIAMALAHCHFDLPSTFRSVFYPILGNHVFGWMGDMIDTTTLLVTIAAIAASVGLGVIQMANGLQYIGWVDMLISEDRIKSIQNVTIWWLAVLAGFIVTSGKYVGINYLSATVISGSTILWLIYISTDDTKYLLNLQVHQFGK
jgi:choline/glycine/proline betaine transport protein